MINRVIIRIKVLQVVYSYYQKESRDWLAAERELLYGLQKTYDLYHHLLLLFPSLVDIQQRRLDAKKQKYIVSQDELNPNMRFVNNRFAKQLEYNEQLQAFTKEKGCLWNHDESNFIKKLLNRIIESTIYKDYLLTEDTYESDHEFWKKVFKEFVPGNEDLEEFLEDQSIFWNDDLDIVGTFVMKTIKRLNETKEKKETLLPMFREMEDKEFALKLLKQSLTEGENYNLRITRHIKNWDIDRIANMDLYIMQIAIAELIAFPSIPVSVTLNEYIDMARYYSTPKSGTFINGILDAIVSELKEEHLLFKN